MGFHFGGMWFSRVQELVRGGKPILARAKQRELLIFRSRL